MWSARHFCSLLTNFVVPLQVFTKVPTVKFHWNPFSGNHASACGRKDGQRQTDGHDEANIFFATMRMRLQNCLIATLSTRTYTYKQTYSQYL
jgi:hypothetical protein